jgi:hypothetical protein
MLSERAEHLKNLAMTAYRTGLYDVAAERLHKVNEWEPEAWDSQLFLGMSYLKSKNYSSAHRTFLHICASCPNSDVQHKAWEFVEFIKFRHPAGH